MKESKARSRVLREVRDALIHQTKDTYVNLDFEQPVFKEMAEPADVTFAQEFGKVNGKFVYCENTEDFLQSLKLLIEENKWKSVFCGEEMIGKLLDKTAIEYSSDQKVFFDQEVGITSCEVLIARTGSIMVSSRQAGGRRSFVYPPVHIVVAYSNQLVPDIKDALKGIQKKYTPKMPSLITVITGPSRTSDIEKTLVMGAHGPKELYVFLIDASA